MRYHPRKGQPRQLYCHPGLQAGCASVVRVAFDLSFISSPRSGGPERQARGDHRQYDAGFVVERWRKSLGP